MIVSDKKKNEVADLCRRHHVRSLEMFGSGIVATSLRSVHDLDFLVEFKHLSPSEHADAYFGLLEDLQRLFDKPVDLVEPHAVTNPFFMQSVMKSKVLLYAAA